MSTAFRERSLTIGGRVGKFWGRAAIYWAPVVWNVRKESQKKVLPTANRYFFCFINARSDGLFSILVF